MDTVDFSEYFGEEFFDNISESSFSTTDDEIAFSPPDFKEISSEFIHQDIFERHNRKRKRSAPHRLHQRHTANLRERKRMESINDAFEGLRTHIPTLPYEKRLSKVDTLKLAIGYIGFLDDMLNSTNVIKDDMTETLEARKVIIHYHSGTMMDTGSCCEQPPLTGHSLSWNHESQPRLGLNNKLIAKIWTPEDPRSDSCDNEGPASADVT